MVKPRLQCAFPNRYTGKDGNQSLQTVTNGKIPVNMSAVSPIVFEDLINTGRTVSSKFIIESTENSVFDHQFTYKHFLDCSNSRKKVMLQSYVPNVARNVFYKIVSFTNTRPHWLQ